MSQAPSFPSNSIYIPMVSTKEVIYPRRETAICICPSSGGGRFVYINWFLYRTDRRNRGFEGSLPRNSSCFSYISPRGPWLCLISSKLSLNVSCCCDSCWHSYNWSVDSFPHDQMDNTPSSQQHRAKPPVSILQHIASLGSTAHGGVQQVPPDVIWIVFDSFYVHF